MDSIPENDPLMMRLQHAWPVETRNRHRSIVAVSGGPDSMALLHLLARQQSARIDQLVVVHVDHRLRESESARDSNHVNAECQALNVEHMRVRLDQELIQSGEGEGIEGRARQLRYDSLIQAANQTGARYIVTGHHRDDQVETILHRIIRGTGIRGLVAMSPFREINSGLTLARPLLEASRKEIVEFNERHQIHSVTDSSNEENAFTRNRIRNVLIPWIQENMNSSVDDAIMRLSEVASEYESFVEHLADDLRQESVIAESPNEVQLDQEVLRKHDAVIIKGCLRQIWRERGWSEQAMSQTKWNQLAHLVMNVREESQSHELPGGVSVSVEGGAMRISRDANDGE